MKENKRILKAAERMTIWLILVLLWCAVLTKNTRADSVNMAYGYILPDSSWRTYSYDELAGMPLQVVCYAKNEIYARNGRMFVSQELQNYFYQQYWYTPIWAADQFRSDMLNPIEMANVEMLDTIESQYGGYSLDVPGYSYQTVYGYIDGYMYYNDAYSVDPDSYIFYDSNSRYLTGEEISALSLQELCYAKNEIYARHGRLFQSSELQDYFNQKNWYWGSILPDQFSDSVFNSYEMANVSALQSAEYARAAGGYALDQIGYSYAGIGCYTGYVVYSAGYDDYIFADSNQRYLTEAEVSGMNIRELNYARNEIYARRGYIFKSQELRDYFGSKRWYYPTIPSECFSSSVFNAYEMSNVELLKRFEYSINPNGYQLY